MMTGGVHAAVLWALVDDGERVLGIDGDHRKHNFPWGPLKHCKRWVGKKSTRLAKTAEDRLSKIGAGSNNEPKEVCGPG